MSNSDCAAAIPKYERIARDMAGNEDFLRIALIEVPPYGQRPISDNSPCTLGRLADVKEWFVTTPAVALLTNSKVNSAWEGKAPDFETILQNLTKIQKNSRKYAVDSKTCPFDVKIYDFFDSLPNIHKPTYPFLSLLEKKPSINFLIKYQQFMILER